MIRLSPRLSAAASLVRPRRRTVDIGSDHGYLPVFLVENGITDTVIAADIGIGPLANAEKTLERYNLQGKIGLRLSDGLKNILPEEAEEIVICGMGGTLIRDILSDCDYVKKEGIHLVLQPMTHIEDVRKYLCENGFETDREVVVYDESRYYLTLSAVFTGKINEAGAGYYFFGDETSFVENSDRIIEKQHSRVVKRLEALKAAGRFPEEQAMLSEALKYYDEKVKR